MGREAGSAAGPQESREKLAAVPCFSFTNTCLAQFYCPPLHSAYIPRNFK